MNRFALILIALLFTGCATMGGGGSTMTTDKPKVDEVVTATIGDIFFDHQQVGYGPFDTCAKFDLTITALNDKDLTLQYAEYSKPPKPFGGVMGEADPYGPWLIKQGFNKTFTYSPKETIRFKGYEFEPISVSNGQITYKRVK